MSERLTSSDFAPSPLERQREKPKTSSRPSLAVSALQADLQRVGLPELIPVCPMIFSIARNYQKTYHDDHLYDEMVQELYITLIRIGQQHNPKLGTLRRYCNRYLGQESKSIFRKYQKGTTKCKDITTINLETYFELTTLPDLDEGRMSDRLEKALGQLTEFEQWLLKKLYIEGYSYEQVRKEWNSAQPRAKRKGSISPFYTRAMVALRKLKNLLKDIKKDL